MLPHDTGAAPLLIALGFLPRAAHYVSNRPLWTDETALALNLMYMPLAEMSGGLAVEQVAPLGFLAAQKLVVTTLGGVGGHRVAPPCICLCDSWKV